MKILKALLATVTIGLATITSASAHDSFSLGVNIGGFGYAPPPAVYYYPQPTSIYYGTSRYYGPSTYYGPPRVIRYAPVVQYNQFRGGHHHGHRGWDRGDRGRGDWDRGRGHGRRGRD